MPHVSIEEGKQIIYDDLGEGTPIVFIHPPGMGRHVFYYQRKLSENMRVIFPDLSGHGDSFKANAKEISIEYYSNELIAFLDQIKLERAVICGYSAGGAIAQHICTNYSNRVNGLILFGGYPAVLNASLFWEHKAGMYMVKHHKSILSKILAHSHTKNENLRKQLIFHMNKAQKEVWYNYYQDVLQMNLIESLKEINIPLLLMYGTDDLINKYAIFFKRRVKNNRIVFFKQATHQLPTKRWRQANKEILQFVRNLKTAHSK